jgi:hypothetical protein
MGEVAVGLGFKFVQAWVVARTHGVDKAEDAEEIRISGHSDEFSRGDELGCFDRTRRRVKPGQILSV